MKPFTARPSVSENSESMVVLGRCWSIDDMPVMRIQEISIDQAQKIPEIEEEESWSSYLGLTPHQRQEVRGKNSRLAHQSTYSSESKRVRKSVVNSHPQAIKKSKTHVRWAIDISQDRQVSPFTSDVDYTYQDKHVSTPMRDSNSPSKIVRSHPQKSLL